jgi:hypothetical protein
MQAGRSGGPVKVGVDPESFELMLKFRNRTNSKLMVTRVPNRTLREPQGDTFPNCFFNMLYKAIMLSRSIQRTLLDLRELQGHVSKLYFVLRKLYFVLRTS